MIKWSELKEEEVKSFTLTSSLKLKTLPTYYREEMVGTVEIHDRIERVYIIQRNTIPRERKFKVKYRCKGYEYNLGKTYKIEDAVRIAEEYEMSI